MLFNHAIWHKMSIRMWATLLQVFCEAIFFLLRLLRSCGLVGWEVYSFNSCILAKGASKADSFTHFILLASLCSQWLEKFKQKVCFYGTQPPLDRTKCNASKSKKPIKSLKRNGARQIAIWMYLRPYAIGACCTSQIYWLAPRPKKNDHIVACKGFDFCAFLQRLETAI